MKKAIATIIAVILLLLLVVALAGSAWFYIYGYWKKGVVSQNIETGGAFCGEGFAAVPIKNIGTDPINISSTKVQTEEYQPTNKTALLLHFNEGSGTIVYDSSGNGNNGNIVNPASATWVNGRLNSALYFNGARVEIPHNESFNVNRLTIEAWVNLSTLPCGSCYSTILKKDGQYILRFGGSPTKLYGILWNGSLRSIASNRNFTNSDLGKWYHLAFTYNGSEMRLYVNGALDNTKPQTGDLAFDDTTDVGIGDGPGGAGEYINGTIDELRILNRSMTDAEIKSQQGWNYVCSGSGNKYTCGDLTITKNSGGYLDPYFDKGVFGGYESALLRDRNCNGNCEYYIMTKSGRASKVQLFDC
jgi:FlaG/FlaF family flagellin (archaellin)